MLWIYKAIYKKIIKKSGGSESSYKSLIVTIKGIAFVVGILNLYAYQVNFVSFLCNTSYQNNKKIFNLYWKHTY